MSKHQELNEIKNKYVENFKKLAKEFYVETGLIIDDIHFSYPIISIYSDEKIFESVNARIGISLN